MILQYEPPQLIINEVLEVIPAPTNISRYAFIFGPQFDLFRYTIAAEKAAMKGVPFVRNTSSNTALQQLVPYEGLKPTHIVDQAFAQLFGANLEAQYWLAASHVQDSDTMLYDFQLLNLANPNKIQVVRRGAVVNATFSSISGQITGATVVFGGSGYAVSSTLDVPVEGGAGTGAVIRLTTNSSGVVTSAIAISPGTGYTGAVAFTAPPALIGADVGTGGTGLISALFGRPIQANDVIYVTLGDTTIRRTVKAVENEFEPSSFGTDANSENGQLAPSANNPPRSDTATFGSVSAPSSWNVVRNHYSLLAANIVTAGDGKYDPVQTAVVVSAPIAVQNTVPWPTQQAAVAATVAAGIITSLTVTDSGAGYFHGAVVGFVMTAVGAGYSQTNPPVVTVTPAPANAAGQAGITAVIKAIVNNDGTLNLQIIDPGEGYVAKPTITITGGNPGTPATATALLTNGVASVTLTNEGSAYTSAPSVTFSAPGNTGAVVATGHAIVNSGKVIQIVIDSTGYGYTVGSPATISFSGGGGTGAAGTCVMGTAPVINVAAVGAVAGAINTDLGSFTAKVTSHPEDWSGLVQGSSYNGVYGERYTLTVTLGGTGSNAQLRIRSASGKFTADGVTPTQEGFGYLVNHPALGGLVVELTPPSPGTALALGQSFSFVVTGRYNPLQLSDQGEVLAINIAAGGSGYGSSVIATLSPPPTGGTQATMTITETTGVLTSYAITNPGSGYLYPPSITLSVTGGGSGAILNSIISGPTNARDLTIVPGGVYTGAVNNQYQIKVTAGDSLGDTQNSFAGATIQVSDTAGVDKAVSINVVEGIVYPLGTSGLSFTFPANLASPGGLTNGTTATGTAVLTSTTLTSVAVTSGGSGYAEPPAVTVVGGGGSGAICEAILINGTVVDIIVTSGGSGYGSTPSIVVAAPITYQGGLRTGDVYFINVVAAAQTGPNSVIVLNGQATDITGWTEDDIPLNLFNIDARIIYSGPLVTQRDTPPTPGWVAGTAAVGGILVKDSLNLQVAARSDGNQWIPVENSANGRLFASWRGLVPALVTDVISLYNDTASIIAKFGANDIDNPVCYGACIAVQAAQGLPIYVISLQTNDVAGYTAVLKQAARTPGPEWLAPMTDTLTVEQLLAPHVDAASLGTAKLWRRAYISVASPGPYAIITEDINGDPLQAVVTANVGGNVRVYSPGANFITNDILPNDLYRTNFSQDEWGNLSFDEYVILEVLEEDELLLAAGPASPINPAIQCAVWRADNGTSQAQFVGNRSASYGDRRIINIWSESQSKFDANSNLVQIPLWYVAAEVAGLRSALLPQQGMSLTPLQFSVSQAPAMFTKYQASDLDLAASLGTFIITQDRALGPIYIRHQLTTDTDNGILYYEDSIGVNLDDIAYQVEALLSPYPGRRNVTSETIEEIETKLRGLFDSMKQVTNTSLNPIGSQIVDYLNLSVNADPNFADRVNVGVTLNLPTPLNILTVTLTGTTSLGGTTIQTTIVPSVGG